MSRADATPPTVDALLDTAAVRWGDREVLVAGSERVTYAQLHDRSLRVAAGLRGLGVGRGDRVAIWMPNRVEWAVAFFAAVRVGAVVVPVNTALREAEAEYQVAQSGARLILTVARHRSRLLAEDALAVAGRVPAQPVVVAVDGPVPGTVDWDTLQAADPAALAAEPPSPDDPVIMLYTSGTTGAPKGAVHTHRFLPTLLGTASRLRLGQADCVVMYLPLFHVYALLAGLVLMTSVGARLVLMDRFDAGDSLQLMAAEGATVVYGVPTTYIDQLAHPALDVLDLGRIRLCVTPFPRDLALRVAARMGFAVNTFGMTETASVAFMPSLDDPQDVAIDTVGRPLDGLEARVVDVDSGAVQGPGVPGLLQLRGPLVTVGYHDKPDETARAFDDDGWFRTGDLATLDEQGRLRFVGRHGEQYRVGGETVDPVEVETALQSHPGVVRAAAIGLPDERLGHVGHAWVQVHEDARLDVAELLEHVSTRLARFKVPRGITVVDDLPTTPSGKVQKFRLRESLVSS